MASEKVGVADAGYAGFDFAYARKTRIVPDERP